MAAAEGLDVSVLGRPMFRRRYDNGGVVLEDNPITTSVAVPAARTDLAGLKAALAAIDQESPDTGPRMPSGAALRAMGASLMQGGRNPYNTTSGTFSEIGAGLQAANAAQMKGDAADAALSEARKTRQSANLRALYSADARLAGKSGARAKEKRTTSRSLRKGIADAHYMPASNYLKEVDYTNSADGKETSISELQYIYDMAKSGQAATKEKKETEKINREAADKEKTTYNSQAKLIMTNGNSVHQEKFKALRKQHGAGKIPQAPLNDLIGEVSEYKEHKDNVKEAKKIVLNSGDKLLHNKWKEIVKLSGGQKGITPSGLKEIETAISESSARKEEADLRGDNIPTAKLRRQIAHLTKNLPLGEKPEDNKAIKGFVEELKRKQYGSDKDNWWGKVNAKTGEVSFGRGPEPTTASQTTAASIERIGTGLYNRVTDLLKTLGPEHVGARGLLGSFLTKYGGQINKALAYPGVVKKRAELRQVMNRGLRFMQTELTNRLTEKDARRVLPMFVSLGVDESITSAREKLEALLPFIADTVRGGAEQLGRKPYLDWTAPEIVGAIHEKKMSYEFGRKLLNSLYPNITAEEYTKQINSGKR